MRISVALCTYNGARYLPAQLKSLISQTRPPDELVVCDDTSTDDTLSILTSFARSVPFAVRIHRNDANRGSTLNFESAIQLCNGDIIALADQDDVWCPEKLARVEAVFSSSPSVGAVFSDAELVDAALRPLGRSLWQSIRFGAREQRQVSEGRALAVLLKHNVVAGATMAFRSRYRAQILPIPSIWVHDAWIALLIAVYADLALIHEPMVKYRQHAQNQIGAAGSLWDTINAARRDNPNSYVNRYNQYKAARDRLRNIGDVPHSEIVIAQLEGKMAHMRARATLPEQKLRRLSILMRELVMLRYQRYSSGVYSFVKDLILTL